MRRERRNFNRDNIDFKRVLYIAGGILSLSIIAFIAVFILYGTREQEPEQFAQFNTAIVDDYLENTVEETSTQMGKTVNEVKDNETKQQEEENNDAQLQQDVEKYAVNTSKAEEDNTKKVDNKDTKSQDNATKQEEKEEIKDPEFKMPVEGEVIREYAKDNLVYSPTLDEWVTHNGLDIKAEKTTVVKASAEGTIKSIKNDPRYGLTVVIEHVNGFTSVYSNLLTAEFIEEGEKVKQGQTIATVGNTATFEIADESHLHFEILKNNENVDPELYIK